MSYVQCLDKKEVEIHLGDEESAFVTEDHRVHEKVELWIKDSIIKLDAEMVWALYELQTSIEMNIEEFGSEQTFSTLEERAKDLRLEWEKILERLKFKPLKKTKK